MTCICEQNAGKITAALIFRREELLYDIKNYCYVEGHILPAETDVHVRHTVQDVGETGNVDRVIRVMDVAVAHCREILYPYTKHEIDSPALNDKLKSPKAYGILLQLPKGFSQTTLSLIEKLIHEYLVCTAVADWLSITNTHKAEMWAYKASEAEQKITSNLMTRMGVLRRRLHPF